MSERAVFAGSKLPEGVTSWRIFDGSNQRCFASNEEGAQVSEFPVSGLSVETIRTLWGPGVYRIQFLREKGGKRAPAGSRVLKVDPIAEVAPAPPPAPPPPPASAFDDPMARAFQIVDAIDRRAAVQAEKDREFLRAVLAVRAEPAPVAGGEILGAIQAIRGELASLRARVDGASFDDDDDDDDDDQGDDDEPRGRLFRPGEPIKDTIVAEALNEVASFAKDLAPAARMFIGAKLEQMASEMKASPPAPAPASVPPPALNGAAPSVPPPPPVAATGTEAIPS